MNPALKSLATGTQVSALHDRLPAHPGWPREEPPAAGKDAWHWLQTNHRFNSLLWAEEDLARRTTVADAELAANKRAIDGCNQARNDAPVSSVPPGARLNSETGGSMIDRHAIMALKIPAMHAQTERRDVDEAHRAASGVKLERLQQQRADLAGCLDALRADTTAAGRASFKVYRQFKMYNDLRLNPALVRERQEG